MSTEDEVYTLDAKFHTAGKILGLLAQGKHPLCSRCKARLIVALSPDEAKRQRVNPGVRCPVNPRHYESTVCFRLKESDRQMERK